MQEQHSATSRNTTLTWLVFSVSIHVGLGAGLLAMSSDRVSDWLQARARRTQKQALTPSKRAKPITKAAASRAASAQPAPAKLAPAKLAPPATPKDKARRPEQTATAKAAARIAARRPRVRARNARARRPNRTRRVARRRAPARAAAPRATFACSLDGCRPLAIN